MNTLYMHWICFTLTVWNKKQHKLTGFFVFAVNFEHNLFFLNLKIIKAILTTAMCFDKVEALLSNHQQPFSKIKSCIPLVSKL